MMKSTRHFVFGTTAFAAVLWLAFAAGLGLSGFLSRVDGAPPRLLVLLVPTVALGVSWTPMPNRLLSGSRAVPNSPFTLE